MRLRINLFVILFSLLTAIVTTSCRSESDELIVAPENESLKKDSKVANLMLRTSMNDGSTDDSIDNNSCFTLKLPFTITANGIEITFSSQEDIDVYDDVFDDSDEIIFSFPITLIFDDFSEVIVNTMSEFNEILENCDEDNNEDDNESIECIDFQYPFSASVFNSQSELIETASFENDRDLYQFIDDLEDTDIATINFPIVIVLFEGTEIEIDDLDNLEDAIEDVIDDGCYNDNNDDDDDDNDDNNDDDDNDDDDDDVSSEAFSEIITEETWEVLKFKDNQSNETKNYTDFEFDFKSDGTVIIENEETIDGTWSASLNSDGKLEANFDFGTEAPLNKLNGNWSVKKATEEQIKLEKDDDGVSKDELFFKEE
ncbi:hypothetical protein [Aquimarina celericrescens]|uniref:Lipocalin-like domain-containing protein n=1 Tax=Aquimarina celericrescens TaxID=1964542 RepID=A0ABW5B336_9FLAO|nr:hypothetical protein [Aquimarina celericrescens]